MSAEIANALATLGAAAGFAVIFFGMSWLQQPRTGARRFVSFAAGIAVAYVFIDLLPELAAATEAFVEMSAQRALPYPQLRIYGAALLGFMIFYGLEHMVKWSRVTRADSGSEAESESIRFRMLTGSYALYVFVVCYLMGHEAENGGWELTLYAVAMGLHFLGFAYGLRRDSRTIYDRWGRTVLAAAALLGWSVALLIPQTDSLAYTLLGFVAGALIMNTVTSELAGLAEGRFFAFLAGGALYTVILLPMAH